MPTTSSFIVSESEVFEVPKPGLEMTERMVGEVNLKKRKDKPSTCEFVLTVQSNDLEQMMEDPMHQANMGGTVTCPGLSKKPMTVSDGECIIT